MRSSEKSVNGIPARLPVIRHEDDIIAKFSDIVPLTDFNWRQAEPLKLRVFKPKFHMTLGRFDFSPKPNR